VPGIVFQLLGERRRPGWEESTARETGRIVLASVVFTGLALLILGVTRAIKPTWMPDPGAWLRQGNEYVQAQYRLVMRTLLIELGIAISFAVLANMVFRRASNGKLQRVSAWFKLFRVDRPNDAIPYARVQLKNGEVYGGYVLHYSEDLPLSDRELILGPPLKHRMVEGDPHELDESWQRVTIAGPEIQTIWVSYVNSDTTGSSGPEIDSDIQSRRVSAFDNSQGKTQQMRRRPRLSRPRAP
jgi:hypothetical protein